MLAGTTTFDFHWGENGELGRDETLSQMQFYLMKSCGASIFKNGYLRHYNFPIEASNS